MKQYLISVVVCTYNRADLLKTCLESLVAQTADKSHYEVIVVNNNSTDATIEAAAKFVKSQPNFRMVTETKQGLSHARNRGWQESTGEYVAYIDDDAYANEDWIKRAINIISEYKFAVFGGIYLPWYKFGKPHWYLDEYASNKDRYSIKFGILSENEFLCGSNMFFARIILETYGGFPTDLGMIAEDIGYGEETYLQTIIKQNNVEIGFDEEFIVYHLVPVYKQNLLWLLKKSFMLGKQSLKSHNKKLETKNILLSLFKIFYLPIKHTVMLLNRKIKLLYWQNKIIYIFTPTIHLAGQLSNTININRFKAST